MTNNIFLKTLIYLGVFVLAVVILYLGCEAGYRSEYWLDQQKVKRNMENFNKGIIEMFQNDTYGGKTPEETFNLFVQALKDEDVDLAVKYFVLDEERRTRYQEKFDNLKNDGTLDNYIQAWPEFKNWEKNDTDKRNDWENRAEMHYSAYFDEPFIVYDPLLGKDTTVPPGEYIQGRIIFVKNSVDIWKIENL